MSSELSTTFMSARRIRLHGLGAGAVLGATLARSGGAVVQPAAHAAGQTGAQSGVLTRRSGVTVPVPELEELTSQLGHPWALQFLPDGRMLVSERVGSLALLERSGRLIRRLGGLPKVLSAGQGGLLDLALSPHFERDSTVYFAFAQAADGGSRTAVARARLGAEDLSDVQVIFEQRPAIESNLHFGSRLVFARDGTLFVTLGERYSAAPQAQDLGSHLGKIVRIRPDGSIPPDNPFVNRPGALPEIWSLGHRNAQGAALHPRTGQLWMHEHGAQGGDELNRIERGRNYGWPIITWGIDYSGEKIGIGTHMAGMEQPLHYWVPSIAPSGMAFCTADRYPGWRGNLFIGSLKFRCLVRLQFNGQRVVHEERLYTSLGERIRDVRQGPDGFIYLLTDSAQGRLLRLTPS